MNINRNRTFFRNPSVDGAGEERMIRLSKSCLSDLEKKAVIKVLDNEFLGMGREVNKFEGKLTEYFGRPTLCVSSGSAALHLALQAICVGNGDEVLVQSLTYVASFQAISKRIVVQKLVIVEHPKLQKNS